MSNLRHAAQQALEVLEALKWKGSPSFVKDAITALRQALAEPEQEPLSLNNGRLTQYPDGSIGVGTPTPRKPLNEQQIWELATDCTIGGDLHADKFARAIERAHGITGEQT